MALTPSQRLQSSSLSARGIWGIKAHWDLWIHLFRGELFIENVRGQPKRFARAGGLMLHLRPTRRSLYIPNRMTTNNAGWTRGWFYLRNFGNRLPAFTNKVFRERPEKWDWGVSPPAHQARLEVLPEALRHLVRKGLTVATIIANFHRQRVIPLTERSLPIFDLAPEASSAGSRTSYVLLPRDVAAQRAKNAVAEFPDNPNNLWEIKLCPETGYLSVVSSSFNSLSICATPLPTP